MAKKKTIKKSNKATLLLVVALFGVIGIITVQLSSAYSLSDFWSRYRVNNTTRLNWSSPTTSCGSTSSTPTSYTSRYTTTSGGYTYNYGTSYYNTGGQTVVGRC